METKYFFIKLPISASYVEKNEQAKEGINKMLKMLQITLYFN